MQGGILMERFLGTLKKIEYGVIGLCLAGMVGIVFLATVARYTKWFVTPWAEEAARYLMIWLAFVGAGAVAGTGSHFGVDIIVKRVPEKKRIILYVIQILVISGICLWIAYYGLFLCKNQIMTGRKSPSMGLPMWLVSACVPYTAVSVCIQNLFHEFSLIRDCLGEKKTEDKGGMEE